MDAEAKKYLKECIETWGTYEDAIKRTTYKNLMLFLGSKTKFWAKDFKSVAYRVFLKIKWREFRILEKAHIEKNK